MNVRNILTMHDYFQVFCEATRAIDKEKIPYVVGGGIAVWAYGRQRPTKDIDIFVKKKDADNILRIMRDIGFRTEHSDEKWLYKAFRGDAMVDVIFRNSRGDETDDVMIRNRRMAKIDSFKFKIMSPEDVIYIKIISLIKNSPHWEDAFSVAANNLDNIDWDYLLIRAKKDTRILLSFILYLSSVLHKDVVPEKILAILAHKCNL